MTEETPGFEEKPDVPSGATPEDAEPKADSSAAAEES
ncbi:nucleotide exchange factor GrpE, partial [Streptomyces phaeoluteigriseus]